MDRNIGKINFQPLHSGIGFHPFSDGLPYAPQGTIALRKQQSLRQQKQLLNPPIQAVRPEKNSSSIQNLPWEISLNRRRFFAYLLDIHLHLAFWLAMILIFNLAFGFKIDMNLIFNRGTGFLTFFLFSQWLFVALQEFLFETTLGKNFFGLEFKKNHRLFFPAWLLVRSAVFMAGVFFLGLGLFYRPQDRLAELQVRK